MTVLIVAGEGDRKGMSSAERQYARREGKLGLGGVLTALPVLAVNDPHNSARAVYQPLQLGVAAEGVRGVMMQLGLAYGEFDFAIDQSGNWWFLELNPNGVYGWLEYHTGVPITDALVDLLAGGA